MPTSIFLAKLIGPIFVAVGAGLIAAPSRELARRSASSPFSITPTREQKNEHP